MLKTTDAKIAARRKRHHSFTLIELLTVMAIIAILAAVVIGAGIGVMNAAARNRARSEIQAMSTALEGYKTDNGIYPVFSAVTFATNSYATTDVSASPGSYQTSSQVLYYNLSGQNNFLDPGPVAGSKVYMSFKANQLGNVTTPGGTAENVNTSTYVQDPWKHPYGYSTGTGGGGTTTNYPYNGNGFFDLWSTGGKTGTVAANTNSWIVNW